MVEPGLDVLLPQVDSKYTLVSVSSKRARKIMLKEEGSLDNPVTLALQEIADGKIEWVRTEGMDQVSEEETEEAVEEMTEETVEAEEMDD
ncbi:MAG: DNA-directed RNA polymerase subunit omega [Firmicutes bacterium]|nr:DNA-directed RNA polymerase subunit omega [Bacillota bacterium]